ncbi:MAG: TAXI family TRAP transporter solute-binding subunit [Rhodospirillales bacterium]|jgi:TRAP transporter TAXI family solute receptor
MREVLKVWLPILVLVAAGFALAWRFVDPAPPKSFAFAGGAPGGAYADFAERYRALLAKEGIVLEVRATTGSLDNLRRLNAEPPTADAGFVQGGVGSEEGAPGLATLASVFFEPVWLVLRSDLAVAKLYDLRGLRVAVGGEGSGTQVLVRQMLRANGLDATRDILAANLGTDAAFAALADGQIDAAFVVSARPPAALADLLAAGRHRLYSFARHEAYRLQFPFLSSVVLPAGGLDLARDLPREETILLAPVAQLVVREDLHPALVGLLLRAAQQVHKPRQLFAPAGTFPTTNYNDFELHEDAARLIERGPSFAVRFLPFWAAVLAERLLVLLIPLLTLLIPLARIAPPAYRWQVRSKIFSKYKQLRRIERDLRANPSSDAKARLQAELAALQQAAEALRVPTSYADTLYNLRLHIRFVREIVAPQ